MKANRKPIGWRSLLKWIFATYFGIVVSTAVGIMASFVLILSMDSGHGVAIVVAVILLVLSASILGITVGFAQWSILHRFIDQRAAVWVGATALGFLIVTPLNWIILPQLGKIIDLPGGIRLLSWISPGILLGVAQWLVLKKKIARAGLWIVISLMSWTLARSVTGSINANEWVETSSGILMWLLLLFLTLPEFFGTIVSTIGLSWFLIHTISSSEMKTPVDVIADQPTPPVPLSKSQ